MQGLSDRVDGFPRLCLSTHEYKHHNGSHEEAFTWVCDHLITYADDLLFKWRLRQAIFCRSLATNGMYILDCLESFGLQVSFDKTAILAKIEGKGAKSIYNNTLYIRMANVGSASPAVMVTP